MKKKIDWLIVVPQDKLGGGAEQLLINLVEHLSKQGDQCCVMLLKKKKYGDWEHLEDSCLIKYSYFNNIHLGYIALFPRLIKLVYNYKIKKTFTSQTLINAMLGFLKRIGFFKETTIIVRESNSIFHLLKGSKLKRYEFAYRIGYSNVDLIICQTQFMKEQLLVGMPWMKKNLRIVVLQNPINIELVKEKAKLPISEINGKYIYIVAAGRLVPAKGFDILIDSFNSIYKDLPDLHLYILGEGPEKENLQLKIDSYQLSEKIKLLGFVNNVYPYFKTAKLCVMSSRIEGFPNVLLQMMSQNTKVVSTLSAGGIEDLEGIFTCEIDNMDKLASSIIECLKTDTRKNRVIFDKNLNERTIKSFLETIVSELKNQ